MFLTTASLVVLATPQLTEGQPASRIYTVGLLSIGAPDSPQADFWRPFVETMRELGYVDGRNLIVKRANAAGRAERLVGLATELVHAKADVIVTTSTREARAARQVTSVVPIVMTFAPDPVGDRLVSSLARPGGNITGLTNLVPGLRQKHVELLKAAVPGASRFAILASPAALRPEMIREMEAAAKGLGVSLTLVPVQGPDDFEAALSGARKDGATGVIAPADAVTLNHRRVLLPLMLRHRLPSMFWTREYVEDGGLMAYSANLDDLQHRAAFYVDKIFKGAKPADLPIEQPTKFDFVINLKAAKALGLTIPPSLLLRADQVIE